MRSFLIKIKSLQTLEKTSRVVDSKEEAVAILVGRGIAKYDANVIVEHASNEWMGQTLRICKTETVEVQSLSRTPATTGVIYI